MTIVYKIMTIKHCTRKYETNYTVCKVRIEKLDIENMLELDIEYVESYFCQKFPFMLKRLKGK